MTTTTQNNNNLITEIKIGDFITGKYKYGIICGIVTKIKKSMVVIQKCNPFYNEYTLTNNLVNVTKSKIYQIGLDENEKIIYPTN